MMAPGTLRQIRMMVMIRPMIVRRAAPLRGLNPMIVPSELDVTPPSVRPMIVMKSPMPTATAFFRLLGIALMIASRTPTSERMIKRIPSRKTAVRAVCHE